MDHSLTKTLSIMKVKRLGFVLTTLLSISSVAQTPHIVWQKTTGWDKADIATAACLTSDGGSAVIYIIDTSYNTTDTYLAKKYPSATKKKTLLQKLDAEGNITWEKYFDDNFENAANTILQSDDASLMLAGYYTKQPEYYNDTWVCKIFSPDSLKEFNNLVRTRYKLSGYDVDDIIAEGYYKLTLFLKTGNDSYVGICKYKYPTFMTGPYPSYDYIGTGRNDFDIVLFKTRIKIGDYDHIIWSKSYGDIGDNVINSITQNNQNGYILAGHNGDENEDGYVCCADVWLLNVDSTGTKLWERFLGGQGNDVAYSIISDGDDGFMVAGSTKSKDKDVSMNHGNDDFWVVKINSNGIIQWEKTYGGSANDIARSIQKLPNGNYLVAGTTASADGDVSFNHGFNDWWLIEINSKGKLKWEKTFGGSGDEKFTSMHADEKGFIITGATTSSDGDVIRNTKNDQDGWAVMFAY